MTNQTPTVLVGIDGSPRAVDALALTRLLALPLGARVIVATVHPAIPQPGPPGNDELDAEIRQSADRVLDEACATVSGVDDVSSCSVIDTSAARGLSRLADDLDAGLLVVAQTHRGRVARIAGVAERLIGGASCGIAVAPPGFADAPPQTLAEIAVAFDGSPESVAALGEAVGLAARANAGLRVAGVVDMSANLWGAIPAGDYYEELRQVLADRLRTEIGEATAAAGRPDAVVRVFDGMVTDALIKASEGADLLVCGSRGWGPVGAAVLGSVSNRLAHTASCPVLAIPSGARGIAAAAPAAAARAT